MTQRALEFAPPYGTTFMMIQGGKIWLMYDSSLEGTVVEWLRDVVMQHEARVQAFARAEATAKLVQDSTPPEEIIPQEEITPRVEIQPLPPPPGLVGAGATANQILKDYLQHDFGEKYRLGAICKVCGIVVDGLERKACPGAPIDR